jgi:hypothetical protein
MKYVLQEYFPCAKCGSTTYNLGPDTYFAQDFEKGPVQGPGAQPLLHICFTCRSIFDGAGPLRVIPYRSTK